MNVLKFLKNEGIYEEALINTRDYWNLDSLDDAIDFYKKHSHRHTFKGLVDFSKHLKDGRTWREVDLKFQIEAAKPNLITKAIQWLRNK